MASEESVSLTVQNTGAVAGTEVVQLYLGFPAGAGEPPGAEAVGSAAWAVARERLCCAADAEEEAPSSPSPAAIRSVASSAG